MVIKIMKIVPWIVWPGIIILSALILVFVWITMGQIQGEIMASGGLRQAIVDFGREIISMGREMVK